MTDREILENLFIEHRLMKSRFERMSEELGDIKSGIFRLEDNQKILEMELRIKNNNQSKSIQV